MSTIRCIYFNAAPNFSAADQHPAAVRYGPFTSAGKTVFADVLNGPPSQAEIDLAVTPPPSVAQTRVSNLQTDATTVALLAMLQTATPAQIDNYVNTNASNLAGAQQVLKNIIKLIGLISVI